MNRRPIGLRAVRTVAALLAAAIVAMAGSVGLHAPVAAADDDQGYGVVPDEFVVQLQPGASIAAVAAGTGTQVAGSIPALSAHLLRAPAGSDPAAVLDLVDDYPGVLWGEPHFYTDTTEAARLYAWTLYAWRLYAWRLYAWAASTQSATTSQWALDQIGVTAAQRLTKGTGVKVAVIDTGVQLNHPALAGKLLAGFDFVDEDANPTDIADGIDNDGNSVVDDAHGHGTHAAGIIATVAPGARIIPIRVLDGEGQGTAFDLARAMVWANTKGAKVINLSLGTTASSRLLQLVTSHVTGRGSLVVAAAGNGAISLEMFPAAAPCALSVTSSGQGDAISPFANAGSWVDVAAPGEVIHSAFPTSVYASMSGSSMSTPFVAAQAALARARAPRLSVRDLAQVIVDTSVPVEPNEAGSIMGGRVDLAASTSRARAGAAYSQSAALDSSC